jgi:cytoskeletal protein RodZ
MPTVSEQLKQSREAQKLTIHQAAEVTKIRTDHLRALEEGNYDVFSAPVYIKGFIRSYSSFLKLDVPQLMAELDAELGRTSKFSEPPPLSDEVSGGFVNFVTLQLSKLDWRVGAVAGGALAVGLIILLIWLAARHSRNADPLAGVKPGVYHSAQHVSGELLPIPPMPQKR